MQSMRIVAVAVSLVISAVTSAHAATYYVGSFTGSTPSDDPSCGSGMGASPAAHPCKTLAYWTGSRNVAGNGDTVRLAPGTYTSTSPSQCIDIAKTGVTYRGSTASGGDTNDRSLVVISGSTGPLGNPCRGAVVKFGYGTSTNVTIRDLTVNGCPTADNGNCLEIGAQPGNGSLSGLTIANVRVTNAKNVGLWVGAYDGSPGPDGEFSEPFNSSNVTIVDSEFDGNCLQTGSNGAGLKIGAVNGGTIARNKIHHNISCSTTPSGSPPNQTCTRKSMPPACAGGSCDCDGLLLGGRNFSVRDNEIYMNEEDGIDAGPNGSANDCPKTTSRYQTIENNQIYNNGIDNFSTNGCSHDLTVRNNFIWGTGVGINQYECGGYNSQFYGNTIATSSRAVMIYATMVQSTFKNNIFLSSADTAVWLNAGLTNTTNAWDGNVVLNTGSGFAVRADFNTSASQFPNCTTGSGTNCCADPDGPKSVGTIPAVGRTSSVDFRNDQLGAFRSDGDAGNLFGPNTGNNDQWAMPGLVNRTQPSAANLHLVSGDTVAVDRGVPVSGFVIDFDGDARPQGAGVDIGADEMRSGPQAPPAPALISVDPLP